MQEIDDGDVKLSEFLYGSDHFCNSQICAEEDAKMETILCLEPDIHIQLAEFFAKTEGNTEK